MVLSSIQPNSTGFQNKCVIQLTSFAEKHVDLGRWWCIYYVRNVWFPKEAFLYKTVGLTRLQERTYIWGIVRDVTWFFLSPDSSSRWSILNILSGYCWKGERPLMRITWTGISFVSEPLALRDHGHLTLIMGHFLGLRMPTAPEI